MKNLFLDTREMDKAVRENYFLSEDIMMENAASALEKECLKLLEEADNFAFYRKSVLILCGSGNNGADGYALARKLMQEKYSVTVCAFENPKTQMCILQKQRAEKIGVNIIDVNEIDYFLEEKSIDLKLVVDCIFGTGFHGTLPMEVEAVLEEINNLDDVKRISCDVPTGLDKNGNTEGSVFLAHVTVTMGALKHCLFTNKAKDCAGKIVLCNLGVSLDNFESSGNPVSYLLEKDDMKLPFRKKQNVNKGNFGHTVICCGEKEGAAVIAGTAAFKFGSGLVTLVSDEKKSVPYELMTAFEFPYNCSSVALGMGFGRDSESEAKLGKIFSYLEENKNISCVLDADVFYSSKIKEFLEKKENVVLTPHPKEFAALLENCGFGKFSVKEVIENELELSEKFLQKYSSSVLILKGSSVLISANMGGVAKHYLNPYGTNALAKGGSGDVLSGLIASLLAQKYNPLQAAVTASLAHSFASKKIEPDFSLTPFALIDEVCTLNQLN